MLRGTPLVRAQVARCRSFYRCVRCAFGLSPGSSVPLAAVGVPFSGSVSAVAPPATSRIELST
eukprot:4170355-Lingulodinium_polyedra.AAC.1